MDSMDMMDNMDSMDGSHPVAEPLRRQVAAPCSRPVAEPLRRQSIMSIPSILSIVSIQPLSIYPVKEVV